MNFKEGEREDDLPQLLEAQTLDPFFLLEPRSGPSKIRGEPILEEAREQ
jgi:hypothetical protein